MRQENAQHDTRPTAARSQIWDLAGITLFRTLGYVVGLPSFIVGTALFMLGFALTDTDILHAACILYSLALIAIGGRPILLRVKPQNETDGLKIAVIAGLIGCICYATLLAVLSAFGIEML